MNQGRQYSAWRNHQNLSQAQLAEKSGLTRAYLARLEAGRADPSLSTLQKLAAALNLSVGALLETLPSSHSLSRDLLDHIARAVYHPGRKENRNLPHVRVLARAFQDRRAALGLYHARKTATLKKQATGKYFALRRLRLLLGEKVWKALMQRIDKHAAFQGSVSS